MYQSELKSNQLTAPANGLGVNERDSVIIDWAEEGENFNQISFSQFLLPVIDRLSAAKVVGNIAPVLIPQRLKSKQMRLLQKVDIWKSCLRKVVQFTLMAMGFLNTTQFTDSSQPPVVKDFLASKVGGGLAASPG